MKTINIKLIFTVIIISFLNFSCENGDKNIGLELLEDTAYIPPYVFFETNGRKDFQFGDGTAGINIDLGTASTNIVSHIIEVKRVGTPNFVELRTITSFPSSITITGNEVAAALGVNWDDFLSFHRFDLRGSSIDSDGFVVNQHTENNVHGFLLGDPAQNAYNFANLNSIRIVN